VDVLARGDGSPVDISTRSVSRFTNPECPLPLTDRPGVASQSPVRRSLRSDFWLIVVARRSMTSPAADITTPRIVVGRYFNPGKLGSGYSARAKAFLMSSHQGRDFVSS